MSGPLYDSTTSFDSPKKRPKPSHLVAPVVEVSRESGLISTRGTMGTANRFTTKVAGVVGASSPDGALFYKSNCLFKRWDEMGPQPTQGVGDRRPLNEPGIPRVGPGTYEIISSAAKKRSPFDGPEYCTTTLGVKLPSKLVPADCCSPGPHHKYEVRKPMDSYFQSFKKESLSHGTRHPAPEDTDGPDIGYAHAHTKSATTSPASKDLGCEGGTKKFIKSTFGMADRFRAARQTSSPVGEMFYAHYKFPGHEEYLAGARSCSLGVGQKTDFSNPYKGHRSQVSPDSYSPITSMAAKTSAFDGLTRRQQSPIATYCKAMAQPKMARSMSSPTTMKGSSKGASPVAGSPANAGAGVGADASAVAA